MDEPAVDAETVDHIAALAHVDIADDERTAVAEQFVDILAWFEALDDVPTVEHDDDHGNVLRPDAVRASLDHDDALANATAHEDGYFRGPPVG